MAYYSDSLIDEIIATADIVQVVNEYVPLKKRGVNYVGLCPFHKEKTPSFTVSKEKQIYKCFGCGAGGTVIQFISKLENLDFRETLEYLAEKTNIDLKRFEVNSGTNFKKQDKDLITKIFEINTLTAKYFREALLNEVKKEKSVLKEYLIKRKIDSDIINRFGIGYGSLENTSLISYLNKEGYTNSEILLSGVVAKTTNGNLYENFGSRLIFPIFDIRDRVIGFGGRVLDNSLPKYVNSPENEVYHKGKNLYAMNIAKKHDINHVILVEGYMDVIALQKEDLTCVVASLGTALTNSQAKLLSKYTDTVIIAYDQDDAGKAATLRAIDVLYEENLKIKVLTLEPNDTKDPDEYINKYGKTKFEECVLKSMTHIEYKVHVLEKKLDKSFESRLEFLTKMATILSQIKNDIEREMYIDEFSIKYKIQKEVLTSEMNKKINKKMENKIQENKYDNLENKMNRFQSMKKRQEQYVISLLLSEDKKIQKEVLKTFAEDDFDNKELKTLYEYLKEIYTKEENIKTNIASKVKDEEMLKDLTEIMCIDILNLDKNKLLEELKNVFKKYKLLKRRDEILERLNENVSKDEAKCLDMELKEIVIRLSGLK